MRSFTPSTRDIDGNAISLGLVNGAFSTGTTTIGADIGAADALESVTDVSEVDGAVRYLIGDDATPQDLFRELAASGAEVEHFSVQAPSLDEIFIRTVEERDAALVEADRVKASAQAEGCFLPECSLAKASRGFNKRASCGQCQGCGSC